MNRRQTSRTPGPPHRLVDSFVPGFLKGPCSPQNPYKTRTKSDQKRICEFSSASAAVTCNFNALKCTDFPGARRSPLPRGEGQGEGQTGSPHWLRIRVNLCPPPKTDKSDRFRLGLPVEHCTTSKIDPPIGPTKNASIMRPKCNQKRECEFFTPVKSTTCNFDTLKWSHFRRRRASRWPIRAESGRLPKIVKSASSPISNRFDHAVPSTYANQNRRTPISARLTFPLSHLLGGFPPTPLTPPTPLLLCYYADGAINY
jgi:hypothetical protein